MTTLNDNLKVLGTAVGLTAAILLGPRRLRGPAGVCLGGYLLRRQGLNIRATQDGALAAAQRGGERWAELTDRVRACEALLASQYPGGLVESSAEWARRAVVARAVEDLTGVDIARPSVDRPPSWRPGTRPETRL